jgi:hypothetical protein
MLVKMSVLRAQVRAEPLTAPQGRRTAVILSHAFGAGAQVQTEAAKELRALWICGLGRGHGDFAHYQANY